MDAIIVTIYGHLLGKGWSSSYLYTLITVTFEFEDSNPVSTHLKEYS